MLCAASIIGLATAPAHADLEDSLSSMLGANVQVNTPGTVKSARRGGFYGGSVYVRGRVMNVNVVNFTPPSFTSGCGGIDLFGGSFSMINKEQFIALLRSIAQNAAGYAFHLALKNICEQCSTIITGLQRAIQEMNQFSGNSCQLAQGIVNDSLDALGLSDVKGKQTASITSGFNDAWEGFWGSLSSTVESLSAENADGTTDYDDYTVNVVWSALKDNGVSGWFSSGDNELMEALMSLTGTIIMDGPVDDEDGNTSDNITPIVAGASLTIDDLIFGNSSVRMLECPDTDDCLEVSMATHSITGLAPMLEELIAGDGPTDADSVLYRLTNGTGDVDDATVMVSQLGNYGSLLLDIARVSKPGSTIAYDLFDDVKEYLAYELAVIFVKDVQTAVSQALASGNFESVYADDWRRNEFQTAIDKISADLEEVREKTSIPAETRRNFMETYDFLIRHYSPLN
jgi:conjugative transfer pilus assembly protein TraH